jgi:hypothetical protein
VLLRSSLNQEYGVAAFRLEPGLVVELQGSQTVAAVGSARELNARSSESEESEEVNGTSCSHLLLLSSKTQVRDDDKEMFNGSRVRTAAEARPQGESRDLNIVLFCFVLFCFEMHVESTWHVQAWTMQHARARGQGPRFLPLYHCTIVPASHIPHHWIGTGLIPNVIMPATNSHSINPSSMIPRFLRPHPLPLAACTCKCDQTII